MNYFAFIIFALAAACVGLAWAILDGEVRGLRARVAELERREGHRP